MSCNFIQGFRPPDAEWERMKKVWDACTAADVDIPDDVLEFFQGAEPDKDGIQVNLERLDCCSKYSANMEDGFELEIAKLPPGITKLRFAHNYD